MRIDEDRLNNDPTYWDELGAPSDAMYADVFHPNFEGHGQSVEDLLDWEKVSDGQFYVFDLDRGGWQHYCEESSHAWEQRVKRPLPAPQEASLEDKVYDGNGLPAVGMRCKISTQHGFLPCTIIAHGSDGEFPGQPMRDYAIAHLDENEWDLKVDWARTGFEPLKSQAELDRDELIEIIVSHNQLSEGMLADAILGRFSLERKDGNN